MERERRSRDNDERARVAALIAAVGLRATVPAPGGPAPSRDETIALTRGAGEAVSDALEAGRSA